jgi:hypothetical protein
LSYKRIYILSSGSELIEDAVNSYGNDEIVLINPYVENKFGKLLGRLLIRLSPALCFWIFVKRSLVSSGFSDSEEELLIVFDSLYWFKMLPVVVNKIKNSKIKFWYWNTVNENKYVDLLRNLSIETFTFNETDSVSYGFKYHSQFYWKKSLGEKIQDEWDVFYVGREKPLESEYRYNLLCEILLLLNNSYRSSLVLLVAFSEKTLSALPNSSISKIVSLRDNVPYGEVVSYISKSSALLELNVEGQSGLTLRALEALFYHKKLITNNKNIYNYSFYHPSNIYVLGDDPRSVDSFLSEEFVLLPEVVLDDFTFEHWLEFMKAG